MPKASDKTGRGKNETSPDTAPTKTSSSAEILPVLVPSSENVAQNQHGDSAVASSSDLQTKKSLKDLSGRLDRMENFFDDFLERQKSANEDFRKDLLVTLGLGQDDKSGTFSKSSEAALSEKSEEFDDDIEVLPDTDEAKRGFATRFAVSNTAGNPLPDNLADSLKFMLSERLDPKKLDETMDCYPAPENCKELRVPRVNPTIFDSLGGFTRKRDLSLQKVQKNLVKGITAFAYNLDAEHLTGSQEDALACLTAADFELTLLRKELIKPDINQRFHHLCKSTTPVTEFLFGDDLGKQVKELDDAQKAAGSLLKSRSSVSSRHTRFQPYSRSDRDKSVFKPAARPFLGPRRPRVQDSQKKSGVGANDFSRRGRSKTAQ